jgi:UDP-N-acetylglucosamine--N-acetylmuramyl-(pentapeptide) pyrophosphoryl-undecaprenol N-acetylglucosamine transferase
VKEVRVLIAGGGTGGHLFPGIAVAEELLARGGNDVLFVGTAKGIEARVVPAEGYKLELIDVSGLKRTGVGGALRGLWRIPGAFFASLRLLRRHHPDVVVGVGGYASGPVVLAAALTGRPTVVIEQNSIPGITNRVLGKVVRRVFIAFDDARRFFPKGKTVMSGNPIRRAMRDALVSATSSAADTATATPKATTDKPTVFVCGGSQGAHAVNQAAAGAIIKLAQAGTALRVVHQTGAADQAEIERQYREAGVDAAVHDFIRDMAVRYARADVVIGRAGATTLAELTTIGRATILIPFPFAADDHQTANARRLAETGAAVLLPQPEATPDKLAEILRSLLADPAKRATMAEAMKAHGRPRAAADIVDQLVALTSARGAA